MQTGSLVFSFVTILRECASLCFPAHSTPSFQILLPLFLVLSVVNAASCTGQQNQTSACTGQRNQTSICTGQQNQTRTCSCTGQRNQTSTCSCTGQRNQTSTSTGQWNQTSTCRTLYWPVESNTLAHQHN